VSPIEIALAVLLVLVLVAEAWLALHMLDQNGRLLVRLESLEAKVAQGIKDQIDQVSPSNMGLASGTLLHNFALPILGGGTMTLSQWRGRKVVLIFLSPRCIYCEKMLPDLAAALSAGMDADPAAVIISTGSVEDNQRFFGPHRFTCPIVLQEDSEVAALYRAMATPMAYLVDENGNTSGAAAVGPGPVLDLFLNRAAPVEAPANEHSPVDEKQSLTSSRIKRDGLKAGTPAPEFTLPALDGTEISLSSFRGKTLLLVFSDPFCAPCNSLMPKLDELYRKSDDLKVLVISRSDAQANRDKVKELGLTMPWVLQKSWEISREYAMFATPIGYLVGEDGVLVEDVAVGGNAIMGLAARRNASVRVGK
jgi:peroxiredoxin